MRSRLTLVIELMVLISDTASAPPRWAARAATRMSVMFGVSLTITGSEQYVLHQRVTCSTYSGTWPTAAPMPRSGMPWGQPKFSSMPSAPVASTSGRMCFQDSSTQGTIKDTISARSGQSFLTWVISRRLISSERSVISSMLLKPSTSRLAPKCAE
ncbi:hypothetical protein D3C76_1271870 [compost metagenome]